MGIPPPYANDCPMGCHIAIWQAVRSAWKYFQIQSLAEEKKSLWPLRVLDSLCALAVQRASETQSFNSELGTIIASS